MIVPDTNIFIAYFEKKEPAFPLLESFISKKQVIFSVTSVAEFLVKARPVEKDIIDDYLKEFGSVPIDEEIMYQAVIYRKATLTKTKRVLLLDCFIAATAKIHKATLLTFDRGDYPFSDISVKTPIEI